jgi:hypothetical protein
VTTGSIFVSVGRFLLLDEVSWISLKEVFAGVDYDG